MVIPDTHEDEVLSKSWGQTEWSQLPDESMMTGYKTNKFNSLSSNNLKYALDLVQFLALVYTSDLQVHIQVFKH